MDEMLKKQSRSDEKIKVALGTLRTKVVVEESEWCGCDGYCPFKKNKKTFKFSNLTNSPGFNKTQMFV